jgi:hypothetical protein
MSNTQYNASGLQKVLTDSLQNMADISMSSIKPIIDGMVKNMASVNSAVYSGGLPAIKLPQIKLQDCNCCPPEQTCPPHCIASIKRCAMPGERIIVPFLVKNSCSMVKTYRVGVRELVDADGKPAPFQPMLNKSSVTVQPGRSERVLMMIDLEKFTNGSEYTTEIVLREKDINQNICFTLSLDADCNTVTAAPEDEKKYNLRWQSWQSHYFCEPQKLKPAGNTGTRIP